MAFSQAWTGTQCNNSHPCTTGSITSVSGRTVVVGVTNNDQAPGASSVTDSKGNTYTRIATVQISGGDHIALFYSRNITGGASHTITYERGANSFSVVTAVELGSIDGTIDVSTTNTGTGVSPMDSGSATTTVTDDLVGYFSMTTGESCTWQTSGSSTVRSSVGAGNSGAVGGLYTRDGVAAGSNSLAAELNNGVADLTNDYAAVFGSFQVSAPGGGRTTKNTRSWPLGVEVGMGFRMPCKHRLPPRWELVNGLWVPDKGILRRVA